MGCAVNGPGEAREADLGISGGKEAGLIFRRGKAVKKVPQDKLVAEFVRMVEELAGRREGLD
jgi:(E)-4-hydroxy-3-methylbut-2-enyl-diphosphate synthase